MQITWEEMKHVCLLSERIRYCHSVLINYKNPGTGRITVYYYTPIVFVRLSSGVCVLDTLLCPLQRARQSRGCRIRELDLIAPLFFMQTNPIDIFVKVDCIIMHVYIRQKNTTCIYPSRETFMIFEGKVYDGF